jgi:type II secretory pathway component PulF
MSKAISSGVQIINSIDIAIEAVETKSIFIKLKGIKNCILNGKSIYFSFKNQNFDVDYCEIIKVGEMGGRLEESFMSVSSLAEKKLSNQFEIVSNTLPYILLCITSVIIIFFFFSVFIPIYSSVNKMFF